MKRGKKVKKIVLLVSCAALTVICAAGCVSVNMSGFDSVTGSGERGVYEFTVGEIKEIRVESLCDINYYSSPSDKVTLDIYENLIEYVRVEESEGILTVRYTRNTSWSGEAPLLTVSTPSLEKVSISGAGTFTACDTITAESFTLSFAGAGKGIAELDVDILSVDMSGAGEAQLSGRAENAAITLSGTGSVNGLELETKDVSVELSGAGSVSIACSENLSVIASGVGNVEYKGSPNVDVSRSGLVNVSKAD